MVELLPWPGATSGVGAVGLQPEDRQHGPTVERRPEEYLLDWAWEGELQRQHRAKIVNRIKRS